MNLICRFKGHDWEPASEYMPIYNDGDFPIPQNQAGKMVLIECSRCSAQGHYISHRPTTPKVEISQ